jgi:hypothetical protein
VVLYSYLEFRRVCQRAETTTDAFFSFFNLATKLTKAHETAHSMTRYTLKRKKEHLEATGEFNVKPLKAPRVFGDPSRASQSSFTSGGFKGNNNSLRRDRRQNQKHASTICFACRQTGHAVSQCPQAQNKTTICYTCGSTDHALKACPHKASGTINH